MDNPIGIASDGVVEADTAKLLAEIDEVDRR